MAIVEPKAQGRRGPSPLPPSAVQPNATTALYTKFQGKWSPLACLSPLSRPIFATPERRQGRQRCIIHEVRASEMLQIDFLSGLGVGVAMRQGLGGPWVQNLPALAPFHSDPASVISARWSSVISARWKTPT